MNKPDILKDDILDVICFKNLTDDPECPHDCETCSKDIATKERDDTFQKTLKMVGILTLQAIEDEPEFSDGDMPDEIWDVLSTDRQDANVIFRNVVRITKRGITERFLEALNKLAGEGGYGDSE